MDNILIVSNTSSTMGIIADLLRSEKISSIVTAQKSSDAKRYIMDMDFDLIVIDTPLPDELGLDLSIFSAEKSRAGIILIVDMTRALEISAEVEDYGIFVIPKPFTKSVFIQSVKFVFTSLKRFKMMKKQENKLKTHLYHSLKSNHKYDDLIDYD